MDEQHRIPDYSVLIPIYSKEQPAYFRKSLYSLLVEINELWGQMDQCLNLSAAA